MLSYLDLSELSKLLLGILPLVIILVLILITWHRFRYQKQLLEKLHFEISPENGDVRTQVYVSNYRETNSWMNLTPSKEAGFLVIKPNRILLHSINLKGERFRRDFDHKTMKTEWKGNRAFTNSKLHWIALSDKKASCLISAYTGMNALPSYQQTSEIYRNIVGQHEEIPVIKEFALEKNSGSLTALILMAVFFVYSIADGFFINPLEFISGEPSRILFVVVIVLVVTVICGLLLYKYLINSLVPSLESRVLSIIVCATLLGAAIPAAKRIDTYLAKSPMQPYEYRMAHEGFFQAIDGDLPDLKLRLKCDYWKQFDAHYQHHFLLQLGGLGFWQFDGRTLDEDIKLYLNKHPEQRH